MNDEFSKRKIKSILSSLDKVIEGNDWTQSNFLSVIGKKLREVREEFLDSVSGSTEEKTKLSAHLANRLALRSGQQELYILLYSSDGANIQSWERIVANLPRQMISRPIYADENDVKSIIKTKEHKVNESYVSIYVNQTDILSLPADKAPVDKLGKPLLTIKDKSINLENLNYFVHSTGTYRYARGRLVKNLVVESD